MGILEILPHWCVFIQTVTVQLILHNTGVKKYEDAEEDMHKQNVTNTLANQEMKESEKKKNLHCVNKTILEKFLVQLKKCACHFFLEYVPANIALGSRKTLVIS